VIGASGAAPQAFLSSIFLDMICFPEFRHWPIRHDQGEYEYHHGDGGHIDNVGLLPLLARQVPKILVFINTASPFDPYKDPLTDYPLYGDLIHYFRDTSPSVERAPSKIDKQRTAENFGALRPGPSRVVIGSGRERLRQLFDAYRRAKEAGKPLVYCDDYDIVENQRFGVRPYHTSICWAYLDRTQSWIDKLPDSSEEVKRVLANRRFPHYATFFDSSLEVIRLTAREANALSNLTAWSVREESAQIVARLGLPTPAQKSPPSGGLVARREP
jgi:hypothetical protein